MGVDVRLPDIGECCVGTGTCWETDKSGLDVLWGAELLCVETKGIVFEPPCVAFARNRRKFAASWAGSVFS
jgi:hypothetical protein